MQIKLNFLQELDRILTGSFSVDTVGILYQQNIN